MNSGDSKRARSFVAESYERYGPELLRYLHRRIRDRQDARELAQEVWRRLLRIKDTTQVLEPLAYVYRVAGNVVAEYHLLRRRDLVHVDSEAVDYAAEHSPDLSADDMSETLARQAELHRVLATIPKMYRNVLLLRVTDGCSYEEIARQLQLTPKTAEQYFYRAMTLVRKSRQGS